jgi:glutathione peroxidase-family protein
MQWNFEKFLVNNKGEVMGHWGADEEANKVRPAIEKLVGSTLKSW